MTVIVRSLSNETQTIDSVDVGPWEVQERDALTSELETAQDLRLVQVSEKVDDFTMRTGADATATMTLTVGGTSYDVTRALEVTIGGVTGYVPWFATASAP